jgi:thymidylate synthase (FAD)
MLNTEMEYQKLLGKGWTPQQARSVLTNSLKTEIVMTCNLREWRHFFKLRTSKQAHPQMREITIPMLAEFKTVVPIIFDDI